MANLRGVNRSLIDIFIAEREEGLLQLALKSGVSSHTISKIRRGYVPKKEATRELLCRALNVSEDQLFPLLAQRKGKAS